MKPLIKVILIIGLCFAVIFVLVKLSGVLTVDQIEGWLEAAKSASPIYVAAIVVVLLFADLFIAVPTMAITIMAGYFLGYSFGLTAVVVGLMSTGITGYGLSRFFGNSVFGFLIRNEQQREEARAAFERHGFTMIVLSRAMPMLPEVTACMAGMTNMKFVKFLLAWSINSIPYAAVAVYAGTISSLDNPKPAIISAIAITLTLWFAWFLFQRFQKT